MIALGLAGKFKPIMKTNIYFVLSKNLTKCVYMYFTSISITRHIIDNFLLILHIASPIQTKVIFTLNAAATNFYLYIGLHKYIYIYIYI